MFSQGLKLCLASLLLTLVSACAVQQQATTFSATGETVTSPLQLQKPLEVMLGSGYSRSLKQGSLWLNVGKVDQGQVYKPYHDVLTIEGAHVHEAYLVVANGSLAGFYLPFEKTFSPLSQPLPISLIRQES